MRKVLLVGLLFAFSSFVSAAQHVSQAPAVAPPVHAAPMGAPPHAPAMAHAPVVAHAPVASHGSVTHAPTQYHSGAHVAVSSATAASNARSTVPPHHTVLTSPYPHHPSHTYGQNGYLGNNLFANNSFFSQCSGAPGLGFDYTHFFATHPNCNNTIFGGVVLPFFGGGGFYMPMPYYDNSQAQPQQQTEANNTQSKEQSSESSETADTQDAHYFTPPVSDYVFVKRDGTKIFAVAYSLTKDKLQYVTKEGLRRTVSLDTLDYEATEKSNEERGNIINLPRPLSSNIA